MTEIKAAPEHQIRTNVARSQAAKKARRSWARMQRARAVTASTHATDSVKPSTPVNLDFTD